MGSIFLLSGGIQSGKTSLCLEVLEAARQAGLRLGGVVSPGLFRGGEKWAIDLLDASSGERLRLAERLGKGEAELATQRWAFRPEAVARGSQILKEAVPCDLLVIDELGPLEFQRGEGWLEGFEAVESGKYQAALLVIRPSLLPQALSRWEGARTINLDDPDEPLRSGKGLFQALAAPRP